MSNSAPKDPRRRISSFNGRIFRNRKERSIKLMDDTDDVDKMDESETMGEEQIGDGYEEVPLDEQEGKENEEVKDKKVKENIIEESLVRRFIRMVRMKKKEPVTEVSYIKKENSMQLLDQNYEYKKDKKEEKQEKKEEIVENKIEKKEAILTGIKTEIGTARLPKKTVVVVDTHEELAIPGTSNNYSKVIEEFEKAHLYENRKENKVEQWIKVEVKDNKQKNKDRETRL
ncbi:hypothetical protein MACK_001717 [Theileria orientalis]|uniref:Uncharacterized protein n=1 Tax=Theileria orientalis TaxID=68886 RepID=A0A976MDF6_THEOR|nr:hypothetical protein MACK_001717 [Theileria orientalis]